MIFTILKYLLFLFYLCPLYGESKGPKEAQSHRVMVSVAPYKYFLEQIAGDTIQIQLLVPPGASFHTYEPTPRQILEGGKSDIWFRIGENFENRAVEAIKSHYPKMWIIDLRDKVDLILIGPHDHHHCCHHEGADLHIWLSPKMVERQVKEMAEVLSKAYPENRALYQKNVDQLLNKLQAVDKEIRQILHPLKNRTFMVSHPAYAYFARDYHLHQLPIEFEGKDPSPRQLTTVLDQARKENVKVIFVQNQYSKKGATLIAKEIGAQLMTLDPYSETTDYFSNMRDIATSIASQEKLRNPAPND